MQVVVNCLRWLEGAQQFFTVLTDHHNMKYIWQFKCLNPHQTRWFLFFMHFTFHIPYRPSIVVAPILWDLDMEMCSQIASRGCPPKRIYEPEQSLVQLPAGYVPPLALKTRESLFDLPVFCVLSFLFFAYILHLCHFHPRQL